MSIQVEFKSIQPIINELLEKGTKASNENKIDDAKASLEDEVETLKKELELYKFYSSLIFIILLDASIFQNISWIGIFVISAFEFIFLYVFSKYCYIKDLHECLSKCSDTIINIIKAIKDK